MTNHPNYGKGDLPNKSMNKHSFFSIVDGSIKIIGLFDGHGENGHIVSSAAMSIMLDYLRNKNDIFKTKKILKASQAEILEEIKKCFKYTQTLLREDYQIKKQKEKMKKEKEKQHKEDIRRMKEEEMQMRLNE